MGVITLMGSGETSPTMVKVHRALLDRQPAGKAVFVDTPYGFQENADEITAKVIDYFATSLGTDLEIAGLRSADLATEGEVARMLESVRSSDYLFSGPGSPSYALRHWVTVGFGAAVRTMIAAGGSVTFASAAAVTAGTKALPVYEIYKVGEDPYWLAGLDLLTEVGISSAVIPHFDNAEGGTHDTRYCYLGQRRFDLLRDRLDPDTVVVGVDEHTALLLDTADLTAEVVGKGAGHFLVGEAHVAIEAGSTAPLTECIPAKAIGTRPSPQAADSPSRGMFERAMATGDAELAVEAALAEESSTDGDRMALRGMITRLGDAAQTGLADPASVVEGYVDLLLELRAQARVEERWDEADRIRARLAALGVLVTDTPDGVEWRLEPGGEA